MFIKNQNYMFFYLKVYVTKQSFEVSYFNQSSPILILFSVNFENNAILEKRMVDRLGK